MITTFLTVLFSVIAIVAFAVPGFVLAVRALPPVDRRVLAGVRPWACDVCMCFWSTGFWTLVVAFVFKDPRLVLAAGPAYTLSMFVLERASRPPTGSFPPPELPPEGP